MPDSVRDLFVRQAGGKDARIVIIPTASTRADKQKMEDILRPWKKYQVADLTVLHTSDRETADKAEFVRPLTKATAIWFGGGSQTRLSEIYLNTAAHKEFVELLKRGGIIGGTSAGAAIMSRTMIASGQPPEANLLEGFGFLPHFVIDQHVLKRKRVPRLQAVIRKHPQLVGLGIDEETAVWVKGRRFVVLGESQVVVVLAKSAIRPEKVEYLKKGSFADIMALSRAAFARAALPFPSKNPPTPNVAKGTLVIGGGGGMPREVLDRFFKAAGGKDAPVVFIPTAMPDPIGAEPIEMKIFKRYGATSVTMVHTRDPEEANDADFIKPILKAKGVWFSGGRQWRFVDAYENTKAHKAFHDVLKRGGVIGGSSAGASIQADYMARGHPLGNREIMAEGYERGLGFIEGVAIDQHFFKRKRLKDMTRLKAMFPQLLGIGIDEGTALIVNGSIMEVVGRSKVAVYERTGPFEPGQADYRTLKAGQKYDLKNRQLVEK